MAAYPNHTKRRLAEGKLVVGMGIRQARTVDIVMIAKTCGFDWLFIDMEHGSLDLDTAAQISVASLLAGITPIVRVPGKEHHHASRILDNGAQGIVIPHVDTAEEAQRAVSNCKFPPIGHRSVASMQPHFGFNSISVDELTQQANEETLVIPIIESPQAVENADAIAAVPGVDVLLIGINDLSAEMGIPGQYTNSRIEEAYRRVIAACRKHNKIPGMAGVYEPKLMEKFMALGMPFVLAGSDINLLMVSGKERVKFLHGLKS
jgi:2-keto-3-deoxy-L-rhamnonate aldolase RhmA